MLSHKGMKGILKTFAAVALIMVCQSAHALAWSGDSGPAVSLLDSTRSTRKLEGVMLRIAKPILKKTPMVAVMDDIDMMMLCPVGKITRKDKGQFAGKVDKVLKDYMLVHEINDELSRMFIYVYGLEGNRFPELILYITSPESNLMLFRGDFTVEGLMKVGELSEQDRKKRIKTKRDKGEDDGSYLQYIK